MTNQIIPEDHIAFSSAADIGQITLALQERFNLVGFNFCRYYDSNKNKKIISPLNINSVFLEKTLENIQAINTYDVLRSSKPGMTVFQEDVKNIQHADIKAVFERQLLLQNDLLNGGIEFCLQVGHKGYTDSFDFIADKYDSRSLGRFISNVDLLQHFTHYFYDKAHSILQASEKQKIVFHRPVPSNNNCDPQSEKSDFLNYYIIKKVYFKSTFGEENSFTAKDLFCAQQLLGGKTAKQIARKMGVSFPM